MEPMNMNIKVDNYQIKVSNSFGEFRANEDFCDVTLACDDNEQIEAHKVILSASSSFFKNILKKNSHSHPLLYLRGITRTDLLNVIDFIYHGEASIAQEDFKRFMSIAEDLKLVGLSENTSLKIPSEKLVLHQLTILKLKLTPVRQIFHMKILMKSLIYKKMMLKSITSKVPLINILKMS